MRGLFLAARPVLSACAIFAMRGLVSALVATCLFASPATAQDEPAIDYQWGVEIPIGEGVSLKANLYRPAGQSEPAPVVFTLTPYERDSYHPRGVYFAQHGFVFLSIDTRGRGDSEGAFNPFAQEREVGAATVAWARAQPWSNGRVAMWGGSYAGYNQWMTASAFPEGLATIVPAASPFPCVDFPFSGGVAYAYAAQWRTFTSGATAGDTLFGDSAFWRSRFENWYRSGRPFADLARMAGLPEETFREWLAHPSCDAYWAAMAPSDAEYARIDLPILTITGHYDGDQEGAFEHYRRHMAHGSPRARARHYLIIGPWDHAGTRTPRAEFAGLRVGQESVLDLNELHRDWYRWTMQGGRRPEFLRDRVAYWVMGEDAWRYARSLEAVSSGERVFRLASAGHANSVFGAGQLADAPAGGPDAYVYDPSDTRSADRPILNEDASIVDESWTLAVEGDGLVYHTPILREPITIAGFPSLEAWIAADARDVDFVVELSQVKPDGSILNLSSTYLRARYRNGRNREDLIEPGAVERYLFDRFSFFAARIETGSRLRLTIRSPNNAFVERNIGTGGAVAQESSEGARPVAIRLYHDAERPSTLRLPLAARSRR